MKRAVRKKSAKRPAKKGPKRAKLDLYVVHRAEYVAPKTPTIVKVGRACYVAIDGKGAPGSGDFTDAIGALYNVAFAIKTAHKFSGTDYAVAKFEGLWSASTSKSEFLDTPRDDWRWTLMIRTPDFITPGEVAKTIKQLIERGKPPAVKRVKRIALSEGKCVQVLHVGPYADEATTVARMRAYAAKQKLRFTGMHHEIYLSDPRRTLAARLRTILRMPVAEG